MRKPPSIQGSIGAALRVSSAALALHMAACSSNAPYQGPPPEYEPARPFPSTSAAAALPEDDVEPPPYGSLEELAKNVDTFMAGYGAKWGEMFAPSGVLLVAENGKPLLVRTYGKADRATGAKFTADTPLRIGSLTKQFTSAAIMRLIEGGKLTLKDPIRKWVKELPESYEPITLHHLLNQTSGVPSYTDDPAMLARQSEDVPRADLLGWMAKRAPDFKPGERFNYSNSNYYLLSVVIERVTQKQLGPALQELVFTPAGLKATGTSADKAALGYMRSTSGQLEPAPAVSDAVPLGAGMLRSTASDLILWDRALASGTLLSQASVDATFAAGVKCPECGGADYGYGWILEKLGSTALYWHNGGINGFSSFFARVPEKQLAIVFLSNVMEFDATTAGRAVLQMALKGTSIPPLAERDLGVLDEAYAKSVAGTYVLSKKSKEELTAKLPKPALDSIEGIDVKWDKGALTFKPVGQARFALRRAADGALFNSDLMVDLTPDFGDPKKPEKTAKGLTLKQGPVTASYVRGKLPKPKAPKAPKK
ncbi:MAG: beta-lactamase family protein [Polyangiaceae bacterium]|nr:beta-lactamase family protein [Polyangiaceae bacterium]